MYHGYAKNKRIMHEIPSIHIIDTIVIANIDTQDSTQVLYTIYTNTIQDYTLLYTYSGTYKIYIYIIIYYTP